MPGQPITGEVLVEPKTGVILSGQLSSRAFQYSMSRQISRAQPQ